jgi:hypothetical protein
MSNTSAKGCWRFPAAFRAPIRLFRFAPWTTLIENFCITREQWCSPGILTRGALQKCPDLEGGGVGGWVQYEIFEILNFVGVYSNNCGTNIRHYSY